jgi:hypothetical protein
MPAHTAGADGWIPPGRLWVSPTEYILFVRSPNGRIRDARRRSRASMRVFVFHEFQNSSRNTDVYDTLSSHSGAVFVPLYMSKRATDAYGHSFVVVLQVAPYDVVSIHASNHGSAGPGIEVAKNTTDVMEPLQGLAGIVVGTIIKSAAPQLDVVNHRNDEGRPMLDVFQRRLASFRGRVGGTSASLTLPFVPVTDARVASAAGRLDDLILKPGASARIAVADRGIVVKRTTTFATAGVAAGLPQLTGPIKLAVRPERVVAPQDPAPAPGTAPAAKPASRWCFAGFCPN